MSYDEQHHVDSATRSFKEIFQGIDHPARQLSWLAGHRLLGVSDLLVDRGLIEPWTADMIRPLANKSARVPAVQLAEERAVLTALMQAQVPALALKGCLLGYRVYPKPDQRMRGDLDVLVAVDRIAEARVILNSIGYEPEWQIAGGTPSTQESWIRDSEGISFYVDLHWDIRNHPALRAVLGFDEQWSAAVSLDTPEPGLKGQGNVHALINASMHWFDDLFPVTRPLGWLLDKDLLWRAMSDTERQYAVTLAIERGVAGLLAESLKMSRIVFDAPVSDDILEKLESAGRGQRATRLARTDLKPIRKWLFALRCEPGLCAKLVRIRESLLPPPAYMRERYPQGSRLGLVGLHWHRLLKGLKTEH
ncbi:MAG: hypothetical protein CVV10_09375 [Gammaproteobacteria bacterium HGW-Gammaproteobacteria-14]|nr:MAG: hypothetical protein CVV10_09375 [Gammaproteobacteria bacterium HGW-Gammaproteobacteria-14]